MASDLVTIKTYRLPHQAEFARLVLEEEGIRVFLADLEIVNLNVLLSGAVGGIKLQVPADQAELALDVLGSLDNYKRPLEPEAGDGETIRCLDCGKEIPAQLSDCPECGWSYGEEDYEDEEEDA
jgi:hypothetical protein